MSSNLIILPSKGCVHFVRRGESENFYGINPPLAGSATAPIIIDGAETTARDNVFAVSTLDSKQFIYTFGRDFGDFSISGRILLGNGVDARRGMQPLLTWFEQNRISTKAATPISFNEPGETAVKLAVTALSISRPDPEFNIQVFVISGIRIEPPK